MTTIIFYRNHRGAVVQKSIRVRFDTWLRWTGDVAELFAVVSVPRAK